MSLAIVFPGQGSQSVGMLGDLAAMHSEIKLTFDEASSVLGFDLWTLCQQGPAVELDITTNTQPALLTASYALWRVYQKSNSVQPVFLAGHSLGEYTALVCAQSLHFEDAVRLVAGRGQFMQDAVAVGIGAMAALIGLDDEVVQSICIEARQVNEVLSPANYNSVGQIVIAGHQSSVEHAVALAKAQGAKMAIMIPVSVPSHCSLMLPAADRLKDLLTSVAFHEPKISVINNVDARPYAGAASIRDGLLRQLSLPVRWVETFQYLVNQGVTEILECGPGKVLTGLNKRINKDIKVGSLI